eukprot:TRINITY_DN4061_c0_g1_i5.p2 TRINITY_DN4061_c0_g1~~TRINITY_DN4061_c0_g1_i5.p2  ORF type:complete len:491 (-),score=96.94 TRINITY_DN4061_c0_g1_i5:12-1484(-)
MQSESDYTVSVCEEGTKIPELLNGVDIPAQIKVKEVLKYSFFIKDAISKKVELTFQWNGEEQPDFSFIFYKNGTMDAKGKKMPDSFIQEQKNLEKTLILTVNGEPGLYQLNIKNKLQTDFKFTIRLRTSLEKMVRIPLGHQGYGQLKKGTEQIFEIVNSKSSGLLLVELCQCFGAVDAWIGNDYLLVRNKKESDGKVIQLRKNEKNNQFTEIMSLKESPLYLLVRGREANEFGMQTDEMYKKYLFEDFPDQIIYFQVHTTQLENSQYNPYEAISHGNTGNIAASLKDNNLQLSANKIQINSDDFLDQIKQITYIVSIAEDPDLLNDIVRCRISTAQWMKTKYFSQKHYTLEEHQAEEIIQFNEPLDNLMKQLSFEFKDQSLYANIKTEITFQKKAKKDTYNINIFYNKAGFSIDSLSRKKSENKGVSFGVILLIIILITAILGVFYLYYRYRQLKGQSEYEIKDSRNEANAQKLEEQELQSSTNYIQMKE